MSENRVEFTTKDGRAVAFTVRPKTRKLDNELTDWQLVLRKAYATKTNTFTYKGITYERHSTRRESPDGKISNSKFVYYSPKKTQLI